jgi:hypothetical protein
MKAVSSIIWRKEVKSYFRREDTIMEEKRTDQVRLLSSVGESHRLEEQLLALAYEQLWPIVQVRLRSARTATDQQQTEPDLQRSYGG